MNPKIDKRGIDGPIEFSDTKDFLAVKWSRDRYIFSNIKNAEDYCLPKSFNEQGKPHDLNLTVSSFPIDPSQI